MSTHKPAESDAAELTETAARELTEKIKATLDFTWHLVAKAYRGRADQALGYKTWDAYLEGEFGVSPLRVPREERSSIIRSLRACEMPLRAIASAVGVDERTVRRDIDMGRTAANAALEPVTVIGLDNRRQTITDRKPRPKPPTPPALTFLVSANALLRDVQQLERLHVHAKNTPGKNYDAGVAAVRKAVETLQVIVG